MRRFAMILGTAMPLLYAGGAFAEDVVIRIEAKKGQDVADSAARGWSQQFPNVVTFQLPDGWTGIAIGPMPRETAEAQLAEMKAANRVPADSFISAAGNRALTPVRTTATAAPATPAPTIAAETPAPATDPQAAAPDATATPAPAEVAPPAPAVEPAPSEFFIRVYTIGDRAKADASLAKWRETFPEACIWQLPNGRYTVGMGPVDEATARAWLTAFKSASAVPKDAFLSDATEMGQVVDPGQKLTLGAPPAEGSVPPAMPPLEDIQRALRWAGHYDGPIDGKDGPKTRQAIAHEVVLLRGSPDTATAMQMLIERREDWRKKMGLVELQDPHTGLRLPAPMDKLAFDRTERALSIYGPKDGSGAALILFSQPGGHQEMLDLTGLVTALGWVPAPERKITQGSAVLVGESDTHIGHSEAHVVDGRAQGFVLIWPLADKENEVRIAAEMADAISRFALAENDPKPAEPAAVPDATDARNAAETAPAPTAIPSVP